MAAPCRVVVASMTVDWPEQTGLPGAEDNPVGHAEDRAGGPPAHVERRTHRLAVQFYGALTAHDRRSVGPEFDPSLATCEQIPDPHAVPDFSDGGLSDLTQVGFAGDILRVVFSLGVEDVERAARIGVEAKHSADAREALYAALERERDERQEKVARLVELGEHGEARRLALCGQRSVRLECPEMAGGCGHDENYIPATCDSRLCPDCMRSQVGQKVERYGQVAREWNDPTFLTLTTENVSNPEKGVDAIVGAFGRLRRRRLPPAGEGWEWSDTSGEGPPEGWKHALTRNGKADVARQLQKRYVSQGKQIPVSEVLKGGIYSVDVKQKGPDEWNVHLHVLADAHWIPQAALSSEWEDITGDSVIDVRRIYGRGKDGLEDALLETVAYACKAPEFESLEDAVSYMHSMKNRRFVQSFGETHGNVPELGGQLLCSRCERTPGWWDYLGFTDERRDNMGTVHSADSDGPPPTE